MLIDKIVHISPYLPLEPTVHAFADKIVHICPYLPLEPTVHALTDTTVHVCPYLHFESSVKAIYDNIIHVCPYLFFELSVKVLYDNIFWVWAYMPLSKLYMTMYMYICTFNWSSWYCYWLVRLLHLCYLFSPMHCPSQTLYRTNNKKQEHFMRTTTYVKWSCKRPLITSSSWNMS